MSTVELVILLASAFVSGACLTALGVLIEFSVRKKAPTAAAQAPELEAEAPVEVPQAPPPEPEPSPIEAAAPVPTEAAAPVETEIVEVTIIEAPISEPAPVEPAPPEQPLIAVVEAAPAPEAVEAPPPEMPPVAPVAAIPAVEPPAVPAPSRFWLGLRRTREGFLGRLRAVMGAGVRVEEIYDGLEEALIGADVGVEASGQLVAAVRDRLRNDANPEAIREALKSEIGAMLAAVARPAAPADSEPLVVMLVGVNGAGKTTTIGKLAAQFKEQRGSVLVAAADTFRAAAIEQLEIWCQRAGVEIIKQKPGSDPAAVAFDAVKAARARHIPTVLIDTAGRLQTKVNLMEELKKIARVIGREVPGAPHETWLVLDATTGQNALSQAKVFADAVPLSGVVLAKLDSTAKGGVIVAIAQRLKLPVRFVGIGEEVGDLRPFDSGEFAEALFAADETGAQSGKSYAA